MRGNEFTIPANIFFKKIRYPLTYILLGGFLICFQYEDFKWSSEIEYLGYLLLVLGAGSALDSIVDFFKKKLTERKFERRILSILSSLNTEEKEALRKMYDTEELTTYVRYHDYHQLRRHPRLGDKKDYENIVSVFSGLRGKGIIHSNQSDNSNAFTIIPEVWTILKKHKILIQENNV